VRAINSELGEQSSPSGLAVLGVLYGRLGATYLALHKPDHALLMYDRQLNIAQEAQHVPGTAAALEGLARYDTITETTYATAHQVVHFHSELQTLLLYCLLSVECSAADDSNYLLHTAQ
jgi:hypothetical protein